MKQSFAVRLSLRFMFILTVSVLLLSMAFLFFIRQLVNGNRTELLRNAENAVFYAFTKNGEPDIPYFISYLAYNKETEEVYITNDPFLPLLRDSGGKAVHYFEKNFFIDGDLDVLYYCDTHDFNGRQIICAVSVNIENDSFTVMFSKLPAALLLMSIPVLLISFLFSLLLTKRTIKPVVKITRTARSMTIENLDGQLPLMGRGDEIDELSVAFNDLFLRIKADFDRERQFSSDVSHELNTPLTVISGQVNLLLRWGKDNPEQLEKSLNAIKAESKSMHAIIENLLQISRIESGRIKPQLCEVDVGELFVRVKQEFSAVAPFVSFEISCGKGISSLQTDPEMLHQIITVFVSNSVKFAGEKCTVRLCAEIKPDGELVISENDDGPGIAEEALPHVFERFYRADEAHTRSAGGSGLGLAIAKSLSEALGMEITADNIKPHGVLFAIKKAL